MTDWFCLVFGFALFFVLLREESSEDSRKIWLFSIDLALAFFLLLALDFIFYHWLWSPAGRGDLRFPSLFLWGLLIQAGRARFRKGEKAGRKREPLASRFFLALMAFSFWTIDKEGILPEKARLFWGIGLPLGAGFLEWLMEGLKQRLQLANLPASVAGRPILFWIAALLSLTFWGFVS